MQRQTLIALSSCVLMASGCTMGLGEVTTFATRNLSLSGDLGGGAFATDDGTVSVLSRGQDPEQGVRIFFNGSDGSQRVESTIEVDGDLAALCPGSRVDLAVDDGSRLVTVGVEGAPPTMIEPLMGLEVSMTTGGTTSEGETVQIVADRLALSATEATDGFSQMEFVSSAVIDGERFDIAGTFEVARIVEDTSVPGWGGQTWQGQPIDNWE